VLRLVARPPVPVLAPYWYIIAADRFFSATCENIAREVCENTFADVVGLGLQRSPMFKNHIWVELLCAVTKNHKYSRESVQL
jgi:outer membrane protein W